MFQSFTSKKRPEKALYVPPGARRSDKGTSEKCGDLVPTDDNVSSASSPTEAYVAKSGHSQGQPWKQPGVSGGGGLLGQGEISQNRAPKERKDRDRGRNQHGRLPPKHNFRGMYRHLLCIFSVILTISLWLMDFILLSFFASSLIESWHMSANLHSDTFKFSMAR